jgi:hypothetical protein
LFSKPLICDRYAALGDRFMKLIYYAVGVTFLFQCGLVLAADEERTCFYLDKDKVHGEILTVELVSGDSTDDTNPIRLTDSGLYRGRERICQWSLNGGSGTKERFSLDGEFAVPILDPACEAPFSHEYTGIGFGDWYLTLCGIVFDNEIQADHDQSKFVTTVQALQQWTEFVPGKFPITGDTGD